MATITSSLKATQQKKPRPFDPRRDLLAVAELIESCFSETLDPDGRRYIRQMRSAAQGSGLNRWISMASSNASLPLGGYVWEEDGKVVGNLSLVPFFHQGRRIYLIANVAVSPEYRRRGIAKMLTDTALEKCRQRRVNHIWLQVRDNNPAAFTLYQKMGFTIRDRRTTWNIHPESIKGEFPPGNRITSRLPRHWNQQRYWLAQNYPPDLRWHFPLQSLSFQPGIWGMAHRFFNDVDIRHWAAQQKGQLLGVLTWQASYGYADHLWLATPPQSEDIVLQTVLPYIRREHRLRRPLSFNYPDGRAVETLMTAGFQKQHTLIWMEAKTQRRQDGSLAKP